MKSEKLLPIAFPPMAIKNGSMSVWTIFSGPYHRVAQLGPARLNAFTTHMPCPFGVVNVVPELTTLSVAREMKLWHDNFPISEGGELECCQSRVL